MWTRYEIIKPYGEDIIYKKGCWCPLCLKIRQLIEEQGMITTGGWADPRRFYHESEEDFLKRIPDGFISWPSEHK